jgi:hypothetical protein
MIWNGCVIGGFWDAMGKVHVTYEPHPVATPESETAALAAVYRFILDRHAEKQDAERGAQLHPRKEVHDEPLTR